MPCYIDYFFIKSQCGTPTLTCTKFQKIATFLYQTILQQTFLYVHISNGSVNDTVVLIHAEVTLKLSKALSNHTTATSHIWDSKTWTWVSMCQLIVLQKIESRLKSALKWNIQACLTVIGNGIPDVILIVAINHLWLVVYVITLSQWTKITSQFPDISSCLILAWPGNG